jgi:hypothetical protein
MCFPFHNFSDACCIPPGIVGLPKTTAAAPLAHKLGVKSDSRIVLSGVPPSVAAALEPLPPGTRILARLAPGLDVIVACFADRTALERRLPALVSALAPAGGLWICWPKRASGVPTDLSDEVVRQLGLAAGLVDNKVCAVDHVYSGLRFVYRLRDRP